MIIIIITNATMIESAIIISKESHSNTNFRADNSALTRKNNGLIENSRKGPSISMTEKICFHLLG